MGTFCIGRMACSPHTISKVKRLIHRDDGAPVLAMSDSCFFPNHIGLLTNSRRHRDGFRLCIGAVNCAVNKAMQAAQTAAAEVCRLREPPRAFADLTRRMRPSGAWDRRLISVRSVVRVYPGPFCKYQPRKALRPSGLYCVRKGRRAVAETVAGGWSVGPRNCPIAGVLLAVTAPFWRRYPVLPRG